MTPGYNDPDNRYDDLYEDTPAPRYDNHRGGGYGGGHPGGYGGYGGYGGNGGRGRDSRRRTNPLLIVLIILLLIAIIGGGIFAVTYINGGFGNPGAGTGTGSNAGTGGGIGLTFDKDAGAYVAPQQNTSKPGVAIPGWGSITIPADTTDVSVDFYNPEANAGWYYMTFELSLSNTGEVLYKSDAVRPGDHIQHITLSRGLPAGTYDATLHVQPYTITDNPQPTNNADMNLKIIVR